MERYTPTLILIGTAILFHSILWARNATFLWSRRRTILLVMAMAEVWQLVTDPIGAIWGHGASTRIRCLASGSMGWYYANRQPAGDCPGKQRRSVRCARVWLQPAPLDLVSIHRLMWLLVHTLGQASSQVRQLGGR